MPVFLQIVDAETNTVLGPMAVGELWIRGPQAMKGYLNNSELTSKTKDCNGFIHTGDLMEFVQN